MTFLTQLLNPLNPGLAPFLLIAAVPLILHLLSLRRLPTIDLSTYRFLFDTYVQQRRRVKILEYLLLLLRILFLLLLAAALMRPQQRRWLGLFDGVGRNVTLMVDCSASMGVQSAGVSSLERAKQAAHVVLKRLSAGDRVTLVRLTHQPEVVLNQFAANAPELPEAVDSLKVSISGGNVHAGLSTALSAERAAGQPRAVYLITDLQKTGWKELADQAGSKLVAGEDRVTVLNVGPKQKLGNRAIVGDAPRSSESIVGMPVELTARVANYSDAPADVTLKVEIDGVELQRVPLHLAPGKTTARTIDFRPDKPGVLKGRFSLVEPDQYSLDDEFVFSLNVAGPARILLVNGRPDPDPFKDELVFLRNALKSRFVDDEGAGRAPGAKTTTLDAASLAVEETSDGDWNRDRLAGLSVMILADCQRFSAEQIRDLREFVDRGGGLLIFPGERAGYNYRELLGAASNVTAPLLPVTVSSPRGDVNSRGRFERFAAIDYGHAALSIFKPTEGRSYFTTPRFFRWHPLVLATGDNSPFTLATFARNEPALVEGRFGRGKVVLAAFPVNSEWSTLPLVGADFVPLSLRLVSYLRPRPDLLAPAATAPGRIVAISAAERLEEPVAVVNGPNGVVETISLSPGAGEKAGKFERTEAAGYYTVDLDAREPTPVRREGEQPTAVPERRLHATAGFAVNPASEESDFATLAPNAVSDLLGPNAALVDLSSAEGSIEEELSDKSEIWRYLTYLVLAIFFGEFFLATLRGPRTAAEKAAAEEEGSLLTRVTGVKPMDRVE